MMNEIRCGGCNRKLGEGHYIVLNIKCGRCKTMNYLRVESPESAHHECHDKSDTREKIPTTPLRSVPN